MMIHCPIVISGQVGPGLRRMNLVSSGGSWNAAMISPIIKNIFGFKVWQGLNCCWRCGATCDKDNMPFRDFCSDAGWRTCRYTTDMLRGSLRKEKIDASASFGAPRFELDMVMVHVLHACDLGVVQDAIGNLLCMFILSRLCKGANRGKTIRYS